MQVLHKLENGKLKHLILEKEAKELKLPRDLQTDTAVVLMTYGELKAKGWDDSKIIEKIVDGLLPIGFDKEYWQKKVKEILKTHGITIKKAMDTGTTGEGFEWKSEGYAKTRIRKVRLSEIRELKKAKFILRRHWWKGQFVVRGMAVDHWDLVIDKGVKCLDEFSGMMNNPLEKPEGVNCIRKDCCDKTPENKPNKKWMNFFGEIPPNHPEWGNPNKRIPAYMDKVDSGSVNIASDTSDFVSFMFHGSKLKGYWIAKRESPRSENWVFSKSALPGEPREKTQARHRHDQCMECSKSPVYECIWAEGHGHAWFCEKHFKEWATKGDGKDDILYVKEIKDNEAAKKFSENTNPNIWPRLKAELNKEIGN